MNRRNIVFLGSLFLGILIVGMLYVDLFQTTVEGATGDKCECLNEATLNEETGKCSDDTDPVCPPAPPTTTTTNESSP